MLVPPDELERKAAVLKTKLCEWEWGYLVGLIEGEGSLHLERTKGRYYPTIYIVNTNLEVLRKFYLKLGIGRIFLMKAGGARREAYKWVIKGRNCIVLLKIIIKLLFSCKKIRAALLMALNKCNHGPYAEKIRAQVKFLNNKKENIFINIKRDDKFFINDITEFELGLLAGLIDGEGSILIRTSRTKTTKKNSLRVVLVSASRTKTTKKNSLRVVLVSACPHIINKVLNISRGWHIYIKKPRLSQKRTCYILEIFNQNAKYFLEKIKHYLIIKKLQAEIALEYARLIGKPRERVPSEVRKKREELYWRMRALNARGRRYSGGPTVLAPSIPVLPSPLNWSLPRSLSLLDA